jgi:hypothetical protein
LAGTVVVSNKLICTADSIDSTTEQGLVADPQIE